MINNYKRLSEKIEVKNKCSQENSFQTTQRKINHSIYLSGFNRVKDCIEQEKKYIQRPSYTLNNPTKKLMNAGEEINHYNKTNCNLNNNLEQNVDNKNNSNNYNIFEYKKRKVTTYVNNKKYDKNKKNLYESKEKKEYDNKSYQGNKNSPKFYRNNSLIKNENKNNKYKNLEKNDNNILNSVAQKICNIIIRGSIKKQNECIRNDYHDSRILFKNMKNKKNNSNITGNKNNKGLKEKLLGINESNRLKYINNRNIEYEEENDEINNYNNEEEEIEEEEINMNVIPTMKKRKAQSIEQVKDKNGETYEGNFKNGLRDGRGNYTLGLKDQLVFPEVVYDDVVKVRGMDIVFVTTAKTNDEALKLLSGFGMPFRK